MLGIDTNVLVRFLVRDDEAQYEHDERRVARVLLDDGLRPVGESRRAPHRPWNVAASHGCTE